MKLAELHTHTVQTIYGSTVFLLTQLIILIGNLMSASKQNTGFRASLLPNYQDILRMLSFIAWTLFLTRGIKRGFHFY